MPMLTYRREEVQREAIRRKARQERLKRGWGHVRSAEDQALWEACLTNRRLFAETFFPHLCTVPFSQMHEDMFRRDDANHNKRALREATAAPRGSAKTTIRGFIKVIHACVYLLEKFTVIFSHTASLAEDRVKQIRDELETNQRLTEVYGSQVGTLWNNSDFVTSAGVRVKAASPGSQMRGILQKGVRPTLLLLDDFENPDHVLSELQRQKTSQRFFADIMKLGSPTTNVEVIGTVLHPDSLLNGLLTNPGFASFKYQAVQQFPAPEAIPYWQEWRTRFLALEDSEHQEHAREYFEAHKAIMLKGTKVLWPERESYYDLMVMRLVEGDLAFFMEKQNQPTGDSTYLFRMDEAAYCAVTPNGIIRHGGQFVPWQDIIEVGMALDPTPDKIDATGRDFAACPVVAEDRHGYLYVLDAYVAREASTERQIDEVIDLMWRWDVKLLGVESNGFASLLISDIREAIKARAIAEQTPEFSCQIVPIVNMRNKVQRIRTLEPMTNNGWLQFNKTLPAIYLKQFADFLPIPDAGHDDAPDSTEMAIRTVKHMWERRDMV